MVPPGERSRIVRALDNQSSFCFLHHVARNVTAPDAPPPRHPFKAAGKETPLGSTLAHKARTALGRRALSFPRGSGGDAAPGERSLLNSSELSF